MIDLKNIKVLEESPNKGSFEIQPLESGFGLTIGNALRRTLLSSLSGFSISAIKIEGVSHEFSLINGIVEDVPEIILNLKQIRLKKRVRGEENSEICKANLGDKEVITAGDLGEFIHFFQVLNPDLVICHKDRLVSFNISFLIKKGVGYVPAGKKDADKEEDESNLENGFIEIDQIYSPIKNVKYEVGDCRVGQKTDYNKLLINLTTDGSISPKEALMESSKILIDHFSLFLDPNMDKNDSQLHKKKTKTEEVKKLQSLLKLSIKEVGFSARTINGLSLVSIETLGQLASHTEEDINNIRNLGVKSREEIKSKLKEKGLQLGMDISQLKS